MRLVHISDVAVPISAYPELIAFIETYRTEHNMTAYAFGHAGDGNIHICTPFTSDTLQSMYDMNTEVVHKAISLSGTATGEHGVGIGKSCFMKMEHGTALEIMREIKQTLGPNCILNLGKIFPRRWVEIKAREVYCWENFEGCLIYRSWVASS